MKDERELRKIREELEKMRKATQALVNTLRNKL